MKHKLNDEVNESVTICNQLKLPSHKDGKLYKTGVATTKQLLRIIQSVPSPMMNHLNDGLLKWVMNV